MRILEIKDADGGGGDGDDVDVEDLDMFEFFVLFIGLDGKGAYFIGVAVGARGSLGRRRPCRYFLATLNIKRYLFTSHSIL